MKKIIYSLLIVFFATFIIVGLTSCDSNSKAGSHGTCPAVQPDCD